MLAACPRRRLTSTQISHAIQTVNTNPATNANTQSSSIETKEPEKYSAVVKLKFETTGDQKLTIPGELQANVAKDGQNQRMEFTLPNGEKVIYLDTGGKHFMIVPGRKQYAELNKEATVWTFVDDDAGTICRSGKKYKRHPARGRGKIRDRDAIKYQYDATTDTKTKAGASKPNRSIH